ncbi:21716_t:CDS:2 [Gigaspora margarita]|uniref:21716_t:CDS:1 n=1 Tax=Gigaspora margarita TaxID=4874 RepID=A0ABM8VVB3_GIGMA|nr:21716_t:CDS:2 [Gigaspora margarita]
MTKAGRSFFNERDIETLIDKKLQALGWPKTQEQKKKLERKRADYILYQTATDNPLIVIETKKPNENIYQALEQAIDYAKNIKAPLVIATTGEFTKCFHVSLQQTLTRNGEEVKDFFIEEEALKFIEQPHLVAQEDKVILSRHELIKTFKEANDLLRDEGLRKGEERFTKEKGDNLKSRIDSALKYFQAKYKEGELFSDSKIKSVKVLEEIVSKLNPLSLVETDSDIKGEAFESFLQQYNAGSKDLGEYFTPRHIIRNLVAILQPLPGDKIYDPFCGTGGMLIECFKYVSQRANEQKREELKKCFFGNEKTTIARTTKMNMILFGDGHNNIQQRNTFQFPVDNKYDLVITNIPFGLKEKDYGCLYDIACDYGDCLAVQHCLRACKTKGTAAMILPEGFFSQKLERYRSTRKWIIENYSIQVIISLPSHIFEPYTGSKMIEEKETSPSFQKIYYQKVESNHYELVREPTILTLPKNRENDYLPLSEIAQIFLGLPFSLDFKIKKEEYLTNGPEEKYKELKNQYTLQPNDILISFMGTLGKVALFPKNAEKGIIYKRVLLSQSLGTTVQHLRLDVLKGFFVPILPLEKQQKAIEELNNIKKMIANSEENTKKLNDRGEFRLIRITDIDEYGNISDKDKKYVDLSDEADKEKYLLKEGDVLMARIGSVGKTGLFQKYRGQVEQLTKGTVQPQFNANSLKEIKIPVPGREKQQEIIKEREEDAAEINRQKQSINYFQEKRRKFLNNL